MLEKKAKDMRQLELISIEEFVPKDHLLRKINNENCNIKCHQSSEGRFSKSDASKGESQSSFFLG